MKTFLQRFGEKIRGILSGFDRVRFRGTKRWIACASGMVGYMKKLGVRLEDFDRFVEKSTKVLRQGVEEGARKAGRPIIPLLGSDERKQEKAQQLAVRDGIKEGLIGVFSCVEPCCTFGIGRNGETGALSMQRRERKCLHYYHYYAHPEMGLVHTRLQTWYPFSMHVCINGREWLARQLDRLGVGYQREGNCVVSVEDVRQAQRLLDKQLRTNWGKLLNGLASQSNQVESAVFGGLSIPYYWSVDESEWATDILFRSTADLQALHPRFIRHGIEVLQSRDVLRFLGQRLTAAGEIPGWYRGQVATDLRGWTEGMRVKHRANRNSLKMYDKAYTALGSVLRIEATVNNVHDFKVYRNKEGDTGGAKDWHRLRKGIADMHRRAEVSQKATERYADSLATIGDKRPFGEIAEKLSRPTEWKGKRVRALNLFSPDDVRILAAVSRGEFLQNGFRNRDIRGLLYQAQTNTSEERRRQSSAVTRKLRILRAHGLIEKTSKTHRYQLTEQGRAAITAVITARTADTIKLAQAG
jgi:DNA-binding MarR family transcriptional regulator